MLPLMKANELIRKLSRLGAEVITGRGKGGHVLVRINGHQAPIPTGSGDLKKGTLAAILKQLGLTPDDLNNA